MCVVPCDGNLAMIERSQGWIHQSDAAIPHGNKRSSKETDITNKETQRRWSLAPFYTTMTTKTILVKQLRNQKYAQFSNLGKRRLALNTPSATGSTIHKYSRGRGPAVSETGK